MATQTDLKQDDDSLELLISATAEPPVPIKKVELDLDDAPFLQAEEKDMPTASHADVVPEAPDDEADKARKRKKKLLILGGVALLLLIAAGVAIWWFFFRAAPPAVPGLEPEIIVVPSVPADTGPSDIVRPFAPFIIPLKEADGRTHFLVCKFSAITTDPNINREVDQQRIALRDAIYYYLKSKDSAFLLNAHNVPEIKQELLSIFNDYLTHGKLEDILFESYLSS